MINDPLTRENALKALANCNSFILVVSDDKLKVNLRSGGPIPKSLDARIMNGDHIYAEKVSFMRMGIQKFTDNILEFWRNK